MNRPLLQERELVQLAATGELEAWNELVPRLSPYLATVIRNIGVTGSDASDIAQSTWLRLLQRINQLRNADCFRSWMATTARREAVALFRSRGRSLLVSLDDDATAIADAQPDACEHAMLSERKAAVRCSLPRLSRSQRRLVDVLLEEPDASYTRIAERTGMPHGAIGPTRNRALATLGRNPQIAALH